MTPQDVVAILQEALQVAALVALPALFAALATGLTVSVFQAATQINEMTLSFIPKLAAVFATLMVAGPWMLTMLSEHAARIFARIALIGS
jgi:flagellar biosynthetic protein FliQ